MEEKVKACVICNLNFQYYAKNEKYCPNCRATKANKASNANWVVRKKRGGNRAFKTGFHNFDYKNIYVKTRRKQDD